MSIDIGENFVYPLKGSPHYQKGTSSMDSGFLCVRKKKILHMCEYFNRILPLSKERERLDSLINWTKHWSSKSSKNPNVFRKRYKTCVILGSSALTNMSIYDYTKYFLDSDVVFAVNSKRSWMDIPSSVNVIETFDKSHLVELKELGNALKKSKSPLITSWQNLEGFRTNKNIQIALPSTKSLITKTSKLLGIRDPGYTSGIFLVLWAKSYCKEVNVIGFYGFSTYEHGVTSYSPDPDNRHTEKTGQFYAMAMLLRLHELNQIQLIL
jgi:hypothetical protein